MCASFEIHLLKVNQSVNGDFLASAPSSAIYSIAPLFLPEKRSWFPKDTITPKEDLILIFSKVYAEGKNRKTFWSVSNIWVFYLLCRVYGYSRSPWDPAADTFIPLKRLSREFCTKNFWSHTAGAVFFTRGTCLQSGTLSPGISYRSGGTPSWAKSSFENWCKYEMRELCWELPVSFRNTTCWWVTDKDVAGISLNARWGVLWFANVRLVAFLFSSKHTIMLLTFVVVKSH